MTYPCRWVYKVIGSNEELMHRAIQEVVTPKACIICLSN
ncbi:MAG TPA: DUF493 family protein [Deltaproteobacteria bacterium]|nr:DUF493 family protein [Deltaproteobacteria bacterium]